MRRLPLLFALLLPITLRAQSTQPSPGDLLEYHRDLFLGTYDRLGHHSPKWDVPVRRAFDAEAQFWSFSEPRGGDEFDTIWLAAQDAFQAHCDDPLFLYVAGRIELIYGPIGKNPGDFFLRAARAIDAADYPPILKCYADLRAAQYLSTHQFKVPKKSAAAHDDAHKFFGQSIKLIPTLAADATIPRRRFLDLFDLIFEVAPALNDSDTACLTAFHSAFDPFSAACHDQSLVHTIEGNFYITYAWQARGTDAAVDVEPLDREHFFQRMSSAHVALDKAYDADPANCAAATLMLKVGSAENFSRYDIDMWFHRAIDHNPDAYDAAVQVLTNLSPPWGGSVDKMLSFARSCVATKDWNTGLPLLIVDAHLAASRFSDAKEEADQPVPQYFANHPEAFTEIRPVYEEYLRRNPHSLFHRARYATIAAWSGQWTLANKIFQSLGKKTSYRWANQIDSLNKLRNQAKRRTRPTTTPS